MSLYIDCICSSILPCSSSPIHVDTRALLKAAGSLKNLDLEVSYHCTVEALAEVFVHRPLEELCLILYCAVEVSSACSPGIELCGVDSEGPVYINPLCGFLLFMLLLSTLALFQL